MVVMGAKLSFIIRDSCLCVKGSSDQAMTSMSSSNRRRLVSVSKAFVLVLVVLGFSESSALRVTSLNPALSSSKSPNTRLLGSISKWNEQYKSPEEGDDDSLIAKGLFLGDVPSGQTQRKKKGLKEYEPHDNRDVLPFVVRVKTPDPYTSSKEMLHQAKKNSSEAAEGSGTRSGNERGGRRNNLVGMDSKYANGIAASIYSRKIDGSLYKILGQFELDKKTNCGDILQVRDREFEVVTARSQFKYAGGNRFVMVRKILEVKEITRIAEEASLARLMTKETESLSGKSFE